MTLEESGIQKMSIIPVRGDKRPLVAWKKYQFERPSAEELRGWKELRPAAWAVVTGEVSGCIVLDFDGEAGRETLQRLGLQPHVQTPSGGFHVYVEHPGFPVRTTNHGSDRELNRLFPGMDIKGDGGYAIAFGRIGGGEYKWVGPDEFLPFEKLPPGLKGFIRNGYKPLNGKVEPFSGGSKPAHDIKKYVQEAIEESLESGRNNAAFLMFQKMRDDGFSVEEAKAAAEEFVRSAPNTNLKGTEGPISMTEVERTMESAYSHPPRAKKTTEWMLSEDGYLKSAYLNLLNERFKGRLRWCLEAKKWFVWTGKRWELTSDEVVAGQVVRELFDALKSKIELGMDKKTLEWTLTHIKNINSQEHWKRALDLFKGEEGVATKAEEWDRDPFLLNVQNGVVDLRTGKLLPHDKNFLMTKITEASYYPDAKSPLFEGFLVDITGDGRRGEDLRAYLQKIFGLSLIGKNYRQEIYILYGSGRNGKSTLVNTLNAVLGDYGKSLPRDVVIARQQQQDAARTTLADCEGVRFGVVDELADKTVLSPTAIKDLTSNNPMQVRALYQDYHTARLQVTVFVITNVIPTISEETEGTWRRIKLVPFNQQIPWEKVDPRMEEKLLGEKDAILTWMVKGCVLAQQERVPVVPEEVLQKTKDYRTSEDVFGQFIRERCVFGSEKYEVATGDLYKAYKTWCEENGEKPVTQRTLAKQLVMRGAVGTVVRRGSKTIRVWQRIGLIAEYPDGDTPYGGDEPSGGPDNNDGGQPAGGPGGSHFASELTESDIELVEEAAEGVEWFGSVASAEDQEPVGGGESVTDVTHVTQFGPFSKSPAVNNTSHGEVFQNGLKSVTSVTLENSEPTETQQPALNIGMEGEAEDGRQPPANNMVSQTAHAPGIVPQSSRAQGAGDTLEKALETLSDERAKPDHALGYIDTSPSALLEWVRGLLASESLPHAVMDHFYRLEIPNFRRYLERLAADLGSDDPVLRGLARVRAVRLLLKLDQSDAVEWGSRAKEQVVDFAAKLNQDPGYVDETLKMLLAAAVSNDWRARVYAVKRLLELKKMDN